MRSLLLITFGVRYSVIKRLLFCPPYALTKLSSVLLRSSLLAYRSLALPSQVRLSVTKLVAIPVASEALVGRDVRTLLGNGALHHEHEHDERDRERGKDEERVEIGERGRLQLAQVLE